MIYYYAMLLSTRSSPLRLDLSLSSSSTEAGPPPPPVLITIPLKQLLLSAHDHVPCPLAFYLEDFSASRCSPPLFPLLVLRQHVPQLLIGPRLLPLGWWGARGQRRDLHLPPSCLDFLPMKCLLLNYSHPTLIVIDCNSRGTGRMTDRLGSLRVCPPRRRATERHGRGEEEEEEERDDTKSHLSTVYVLHHDNKVTLGFFFFNQGFVFLFPFLTLWTVSLGHFGSFSVLTFSYSWTNFCLTLRNVFWFVCF